MKRSMVETLLGGVVIVVAAGFMIFALQATEVGAVDGIGLEARFLKIGGLEVGSDGVDERTQKDERRTRYDGKKRAGNARDHQHEDESDDTGHHGRYCSSAR